MSEPLAIVDTNLEAASEMLKHITVVVDNDIIYADTRQDPNFLTIHERMDALETVEAGYTIDSACFSRREIGAVLAKQKLLAYSIIDPLESSTPLYTEPIRFVQQNGALGTIGKQFENVEDVTEAAQRSRNALDTVALDSFDLPEHYAIDQITAENAVFGRSKTT